MCRSVCPLRFINCRIKAKRDRVPSIAYFGFQKNYEEPSLEEGFSEIVDVRWHFEGGEEERRRWSTLHQSINGK